MVNIMAAFIFLVMFIILTVAFYFNNSLVDELQEASNFDNWKFFIISAAVISCLGFAVFLTEPLKIYQMYDGGYNSVVAETIYILGIGVELARPEPLGGSGPSLAASSIASIFGFGYDDEFKWTYAGRKPMPRQDPGEEESDAASPIADQEPFISTNEVQEDDKEVVQESLCTVPHCGERWRAQGGAKLEWAVWKDDWTGARV